MGHGFNHLKSPCSYNRAWLLLLNGVRPLKQSFKLNPGRQAFHKLNLFWLSSETPFIKAEMYYSFQRGLHCKMHFGGCNARPEKWKNRVLCVSCSLLMEEKINVIKNVKSQNEVPFWWNMKLSKWNFRIFKLKFSKYFNKKLSHEWNFRKKTFLDFCVFL